MKQKSRAFLSVLIITAMALSIISGKLFVTEAAVGTLSKNTGTRHTVAAALSNQAKKYYNGNYSYDVLSKVKGGTSDCLEAMNSGLYEQLNVLMTDTMTKSFSYSSLTSYWSNTDASNSSVNAAMIYSDSTSSETYSREHVWPKSRASFKETGGGSDIQHLRPENSAINSTRSNYTFGNVRDVLSTFSVKTYEEKDVLYYSPSNDLVEVNDNVKGDIARILLYVYVRWEEPNLFMDAPNPVIGANDDQNDGKKVIESLDTLLEWCRMDPVDTWEMSRNDQCENLQGNRNVFIDYPEYAWLLFGKTVPSNMTTPSGGESFHGSTSYTQITSADEIADGESYVLVAENEGSCYALGNTISSKLDCVPVSVSGNTVTGESLPVWEMSKTAGGVSLKSGTAYLSYSSSTNFKSSTESYEWNISQPAANGTFRFSALGDTSRLIAYSTSLGKFGAYSASNTNGYVFDLMLFKLKNSSSNTPGDSGNENNKDILIGDVNKDNLVNIQDVTILQKYLAGIKNENGNLLIDITNKTQLLIADFDGNGIVSVEDATSIQKYIVLIIS